MVDLTRQERMFLWVLSLVVLTGSGISYFLKRFPDLSHKVAFSERARFPHKIDINSASFDEILKIPYVGEKRATQILHYRTTRGLFKNIEQIQDIYGIGPKTFLKMDYPSATNSYY